MKKIVVVLFVLLFSFANIPILNGGIVSLQWDSPTTNTDFTPLTDLAGYKMYWGTSSGSYSDSVAVSGCAACPAPISAVAESWCIALNPTSDTTYYFAVTAYDTSSNESIYSNEVSKFIVAVLPRGNIDIISPGSVNRVDGYDLSALLWYFGGTVVRDATTCSFIDTVAVNADLNEDGVVDVSDLTIITANFGSSI